MDLIDRCGECYNCKVVLEAQKSVLRAVNPPFSHANDDVVKVWNDTLDEYPCEEIVVMMEIKDGEDYAPVRGVLKKLLKEHAGIDSQQSINAIRANLKDDGKSTVICCTPSLMFFPGDILQRLKKAQEHAALAFWEVIAEYYPEATSGDGADAFDVQTQLQVAGWIRMNCYRCDDEETPEQVKEIGILEQFIRGDKYLFRS